MKLLIGLLLLIILTPSFAEFMPKSFSASFEQEYISLLKGNAKKGAGSLDYMYPSNIRFETTTPSQVIFVSNGIKAWYYRAPFIEGEPGEVNVSSAKEASSSYTKFFDSLKNGLNSNTLYEVKNAGDGIHVVKFKEKTAKDIGVKEAILTFSKASSKEFSDLSKIELSFVDGKKSTLKFSQLKVNPNFDSQKFNFQAPAGTKVVN